MTTADFLLEVGVEELPHGYIDAAREALATAVEKKLNGLGLSHTSLRAYSTPRRLALIVKKLATQQSDSRLLKKGPPLVAAFKDGILTPAGKGFITSVGVTSPPNPQDLPSSPPEVGLFKKEEKGKNFLYHASEVKGQSTETLLKNLLPSLLSSLPFPKAMRWADLDVPFYRPLRWLVCLLGDRVIGFEMAGIRAHHTSWGHRQLGEKKPFPVTAANYVATLKEQGVIVDPEARQSLILQQLQAIEKDTGCLAHSKERVLREVTNLVEWPYLVCCQFDETFLKVPQEVLISEMVEHQMYFPLLKEQGTLANLFVVTANIKNKSNVKSGNVKVLTSRFRDGAFLYQEDLKLGLTALGERLSKVTYQQALGSYKDKVERMLKLGAYLGAKKPPEVKQSVLEAISKCKNDLTSNMVGEFPHLQGIMGAYYAKGEGLPLEVSDAISEHYLPTSAGGRLPKSEIGALTALADKWDTLLGSFSVGLIPTGSHDPYALRRLAFGIIRILIERQIPLSLRGLVDEALPRYRGFLTNNSNGRDSTYFKSEQDYKKAILDFIANRVASHFKEEGFAADVIEAGVTEGMDDIYSTYLAAKSIEELKQKPFFKDLTQILKRVKNILKKEDLVEEPSAHGEPSAHLSDHLPRKWSDGEPSPRLRSGTGGEPSPELFQLIEEKNLFAFYRDKKSPIKALLNDKKFTEAFTEFAKCSSILEIFFDNVMVKVENKEVRMNRLKLLKSIDGLIDKVLDFSKLVS